MSDLDNPTRHTDDEYAVDPEALSSYQKYIKDRRKSSQERLRKLLSSEGDPENACQSKPERTPEVIQDWLEMVLDSCSSTTVDCGTFQNPETGEDVFIIYRLMDKTYYYDPETGLVYEPQTYNFREHRGIEILESTQYIPVADPFIIKCIKKQAAHDENIKAERNGSIEKLAENNEDLRLILEWNMRYRRRTKPDDPNIKMGIPFWLVGHNASHWFYIGLKDGKIFKCADGEDFIDDDGFPASYPIEERIKEVEGGLSNIGYMGHF